MWRSHTTAGVGRGLTEKCSPPPSACCLVIGGGGDWKKLCVWGGRGCGDIFLDGFPPLLEVSRAYTHARESPRDGGFRSVVDLITPLSDPCPKHVCVMGSAPRVFVRGDVTQTLLFLFQHLSPHPPPSPPRSFQHKDVHRCIFHASRHGRHQLISLCQRPCMGDHGHEGRRPR
jgi:hypothetical protein